MSDKTKMLCLGSLLLSYSMITNMVPLPDLIDESVFIGLAFPFFTKRNRIKITLSFQAIMILNVLRRAATKYIKYEAFIKEALKNKASTGSYIDAQPINTTLSQSTVFIKETYNQFEIFKIINPTQSAILTASLYIIIGIGLTFFIIQTLYGFALILALPFLLLITFTAPYSIYIILKKLGFYKIVEQRTKGTIQFQEMI